MPFLVLREDGYNVQEDRLNHVVYDVTSCVGEKKRTSTPRKGGKNIITSSIKTTSPA